MAETTMKHFILYDISGSTEYCPVEVDDGTQISYFDYLTTHFMERLNTKFPAIEFTYIAWDNEAKITEGIIPESRGGTDPSEAFDLLSKIISENAIGAKFIHLVTDGDIYGFNYQKIEMLNDTDRIDIHYLGNANHNIAFYQAFKEKLMERCNVYVNSETIVLYDDITDAGELEISEEDQLAILNHDFRQTAVSCPAFNKLLATVASFGKNPKYKEAIKKTLSKLAQKSKGNTENLILPDDIPMKEVIKHVKDYKSRVVKNFDTVVSYIMSKLDACNFNSGALSGNVFLRNLDRDYEFRKQSRLKAKQDAEEQKKSGVENDDLKLDDDNVEEPSYEEKKDNDLLCAISLDKIQGPYLLEAAINDNTVSASIIKHINQIRRFPWYIFYYLPDNVYQQKLNVMLTPYTLENFFALNQNVEPNQNLYSTLYNFSRFSFVLLHKNQSLRAFDTKILLQLNYVWACNFFFNKRPTKQQASIGKVFEVTYIYLLLLQEHFKLKKVSQVYLDDVEFTLETLGNEKESLCKMPQFSIYYSINLFKRILTESKVLEPKSDPVACLLIRRKLGLTCQQLTDNVILFMGCLQWMNSGKCPDILSKHQLLDEKSFEEIMGFPVPKVKEPAQKIFRMLLQNFIKSVENQSKFLFVNELLPLKEFYYNQIPQNFMHFLIHVLNYTNLPILPRKKSRTTSKDNKNLFVQSMLSYNHGFTYTICYEKFLYNEPIFVSSTVDVCWSTLRPRAILENGKAWSTECPVQHEESHKETMECCLSKHLSLHKNFLECYKQHKTSITVDDVFEYLLKSYPTKTFQPEILEDLKKITEIYSKIFSQHYKNDAKAIVDIIERTYNMKAREEIENLCQVSECFHKKA